MVVCSGLLSGHVLASFLKEKSKGLAWYDGALLDMAKDLGYRLLPAFNTSTGIPFPKVRHEGVFTVYARRNDGGATLYRVRLAVVTARISSAYLPNSSAREYSHKQIQTLLSWC